ncbi:MAG: hypothetical protein WD602_10660 [Actinomycetota bacterium]
MNATPRWLPWTAVAFGATLGHTFIDYHLGLMGERAASMSVHQGAAVLSVALMFAFWLALAAAAAAGDTFALRALFWLTVLEAVLLNGALAVAAAPPPSEAFPFQDLFHLGSLTAGVLASRQIWIAQRRAEPVGSLTWLVMVGVVIVIVTVTTASLQMQAL